MSLIDIIFGSRPKPDFVADDVVEHAPDGAVLREVRPKPDSAPVRAWSPDLDRTVRSSSGELRARAGRDMIVSHGVDDHSVVRTDIFERTYEPLGGGLYRKRDDVVLRYFTLDHPVMVQTLEGPQRAEAGDWIIEGVSGELWPVPVEKAHDKYQLL